MLRIGIFWVCGFRAQLTAEGIGRHMIRLADGLLAVDSQLEIILVTDTVNFEEAVTAFSHVGRRYGTRINFIAVDDVGLVNANAAVDIWIVPNAGLWKALQLNKPFILCLHDLGYIHFPERPQDNHSQLIDTVVPYLAQNAAAVVCNSNFVRENEGLRYLKLPPDKVKTVRLASPLEEYQSFGIMEEAAFRKKYGFTTPYFVYPSAMRYYKNHYRLIEAFINFRNSSKGYDTNLLLIMTDNFLHYPDMHEIKELAPKCLDETVRNSIVFTGRFPANEMPSLYSYAAGTIVPTLFEGSCPFPILESSIVGTPVAFSDISVVWEVIPKTKEVISFDPYSVKDMEKAICRLWQNRKLCSDRQFRIPDRTWQDVAREYISIIQTVLN
ncbi:MAG: glycosyltransferase family 4 protein [Veillonellaceae bacterium]|jgi:glycosyltransferase involved in cell wall biosynthesis|nr:glycosyltransferase family 4 protein [Veillonellaceae bacterium]